MTFRAKEGWCQLGRIKVPKSTFKITRLFCMEGIYQQITKIYAKNKTPKIYVSFGAGNPIARQIQITNILKS